MQRASDMAPVAGSTVSELLGTTRPHESETMRGLAYLHVMRAARLLHPLVSALELPVLSGKVATASQLRLIARRINIEADIRPAELRGKLYPVAVLPEVPELSGKVATASQFRPIGGRVDVEAHTRATELGF